MHLLFILEILFIILDSGVKSDYGLFRCKAAVCLFRGFCF